MSSDISDPPPSTPTAAAVSTVKPFSPPAPARKSRGVWLSALLFALIAAALSAVAWLWQEVIDVQSQLSRQNTEVTTATNDARTMAKQAQELARDTAAKQSLADTRIGEVALQRKQLDELMQSLSRSRDENLVVDIDSGLRLAQQQAQMTGSLEPLLSALKSADQRVTRAAQPRLQPLQRALQRDAERLHSMQSLDLKAILFKLDDLIAQIDNLSLVNAKPDSTSGTHTLRSGASPKPAQTLSANAPWWQRGAAIVGDELQRLVRVSRIDQPDAALLAPEQSYYVRENLKLQLMGVRNALQAHQYEMAQTGLLAATTAMNKYFDLGDRKTQTAMDLLKQVQAQTKASGVPKIDDSLAALATAAVGH